MLHAEIASAHFLFIRIGSHAEAGRTVEVFFSERAEAGDPRFIEKIAGTKLAVQTKPGQFRPLTVRQGADRLRAFLPASGSASVDGELVYGVLTQTKKCGRLRRRAELHLGLTTIAINNQPVKIQTGGYALKGEKQGTGKKVVGGAAIGRLYGGDKKGARRGAAVGLTAAALSSKQIKVPPGTLMEFQLKAPFTVQ